MRQRGGRNAVATERAGDEASGRAEDCLAASPCVSSRQKRQRLERARTHDAFVEWWKLLEGVVEQQQQQQQQQQQAAAAGWGHHEARGRGVV